MNDLTQYIDSTRSIRDTARDMYLASWEYAYTELSWHLLPSDRKRHWLYLAERRINDQGKYMNGGGL